jgi:hypothetical protein
MTRAARLAVLLALSLPAIATAAAAFDPSHKRIVIHSSIAGVKLGQSIKGAKRAWHGAAKCSGHGDATTCNWGTERKGHLGFIFARGTDRVIQVSISAGTSALHKSVFRKPLTTVKTSKGLGLGSKKSAVKKAHPGGHSRDGPDYCIKRGNTTTTFVFDGRRVISITMYRGYGDQLATCD